MLDVEQRYLNVVLTEDGRRIDHNVSYNMSTLAKGTRLCGEDHPNYGKTHSEETKRKMSVNNGMRGKPSAMRGRTHSEETRRLLSESQRGKVFSEEHRRNLVIAQSKRKPVSAQTRLKMSEARLGAKHINSRAVNQYSKSGEKIKTFGALMDADRETGVAYQSISKVCRGKLNSAGGFVWRYVDDDIQEVAS